MNLPTSAKAAGIRRHAAELATLAPDVILASGTATICARRLLRRMSQQLMWWTAPAPGNEFLGLQVTTV
jgi:hypothetical protein